MKYYVWDPDKNNKLVKERNISFEEIVLNIMESNLLDVYEHPNEQEYPDQKIYVVNVNNYAHLIPFKEMDNEIKLITIIPSRKATRDYLRKDL